MPPPLPRRSWWPLRDMSTGGDLIGALLEDGKTYTLNEVDALIEKFMKGKVR